MTSDARMLAGKIRRDLLRIHKFRLLGNFALSISPQPKDIGMIMLSIAVFPVVACCRQTMLASKADFSIASAAFEITLEKEEAAPCAMCPGMVSEGCDFKESKEHEGCEVAD